MLTLHCNCWVANTKVGGVLTGVPSGRCLVGSPEMFGPSPENLYTLCKVFWFGLVWFFSYRVAVLNALTSKEALSRQSLQKYLEDLQIQNLKIFFNPASPSNLSQ